MVSFFSPSLSVSYTYTHTYALFLICPSSNIWYSVDYWLGFVVRQDNRSMVPTEKNLMNGCSLSRTKRPPLYFTDVSIRLSWLPSEFIHWTFGQTDAQGHLVLKEAFSLLYRVCLPHSAHSSGGC